MAKQKLKVKPLFKKKKSHKELLLEQLRLKNQEKKELVVIEGGKKEVIKKEPKKKKEVIKKEPKKKSKKANQKLKTKPDTPIEVIDSKKDKDENNPITYVQDSKSKIKVLEDVKGQAELTILYQLATKKKTPKELGLEQLRGKKKQKYYIAVHDEESTERFNIIGKLIEKGYLQRSHFAMDCYYYEVFK